MQQLSCTVNDNISRNWNLSSANQFISVEIFWYLLGVHEIVIIFDPQ